MPKNTPCPSVSIPPRPQANPMPTATIAKHRNLASRLSLKSDSSAGATRKSAAAATPNPAHVCQRPSNCFTSAPRVRTSYETPGSNREQALRADLEEEHDDHEHDDLGQRRRG